MHNSILAYKKHRYDLWSLALIVLCLAIYLSQGEMQVPNGGTWQGYALGSVATLLILLLTALGIRKRSYSSSLGSLQGWTSAHVYLGISVLLIATMHNAAQFGWNVHTLAYVFMWVVIFSGGVGLYTYMRYPHMLSTNRAGRTNSAMFAELNNLNEKGTEISRRCDPIVQQVIETSISRTSIGGGLVSQLFARDKSQCLLQNETQNSTAAALTSNIDQNTVIHYVAQRIPKARKLNEASELQSLLAIMCRRQVLLRQIRRDIQLRAGLQLWLYIHIPMTIALLASLLIHIISVFFFW